MQGYAVLQIARQIGESNALTTYVGTIVHKVFKNKEKAENLANKLAVDASKRGEQTISTTDDTIQCYLGEIHVHEVEIEE